jgi:uncharacterized protein YuzE
MNKPTVRYDDKADVLYFLIKEGIEDRFVEVAEGVYVELDRSGELLGVEVLNASQWLRQAVGAQRLMELAQAA